MKMDVNFLNILFFTIVFVTSISNTYGETKYECIRRVFIGGEEMENEMDEGFEAEDFHEMEGDEEGGAGPMVGTLDCTTQSKTIIMVTKLIYGYGGPAGCSSPDETCDEEAYSDREISPQCDGQTKCAVTAMPQVLPKCPQRRSDFIHVEYECILPESLFQICNETSAIVKTPYFLIQSPGKAAIPKGGYAMCECIMKSRFADSLLMEYTHINMFDPSSPPITPGTPTEPSKGACTGNYILFESRSSPNQTKIDNKLQICGRKTVSNKIFRGSLRLTFASKSMIEDEGFLTKLQVKVLNGASMVNIQCGKVDLPPNSPLLNNNGQNAVVVNRPRNMGPFAASPFLPGPVPPPYWQFGLQPGPFMPPQFNGPPFPGRGTPRQSGNFGLGNTNGASKSQTPGQTPSRKWVNKVAQATTPAARLPSNLDFLGSRRNFQRAQKHQTEVEEVVTKDKDPTDTTGQLVGYIVGGVGAALAAICAIIIVFVYSKRKKQYMRRRDMHPMASFRNSGRRRVQIEVDPVYSTPAEVNERRHRVAAHTHSNSAYVSDPPERTQLRYDDPIVGGTSMDADGYSTVALASRGHVDDVEMTNERDSDTHAIVGQDYDNNFRRGRR